MEQLDNIQLKKRYGKKIDSILEEVLNKNCDLYGSPKIMYYIESDWLNRVLYHNLEDKAFCDKNRKVIYLSDTVCKSNDSAIFEVIVHELIHLTYPDYNENRVIEETEKRTGNSKRIRDLVDSIHIDLYQKKLK